MSWMICFAMIYPADALAANTKVRGWKGAPGLCHKVNGVSKLHSEILTNSIFRDYYEMEPDHFCNVTRTGRDGCR